MASVSQTPSIYQIRHIESGKVYVGSAANPRQRRIAHFTALRHGKHHSRHLQRAWDKYGEATFVFEILEPVLFIEDLIAREQYWIDTLRASKSAHGYNTSPTAGSSLGTKQTDAQRAANSERAKKQGASPAAKARLAAWTKEQFKDPEYRARFIKSQRKRYDDPSESIRRSERMNAFWADPVNRAKASEQGKAFCADPVNRERLAAQSRALAADPAIRARMSEKGKARYADPAFRKRHSDQAKARYADPVFRARQKMLSDERKKNK